MSEAQGGLRLLFLLPYTPHPEAFNGSGRAMAQLLLVLSRRHQVAVLYFRDAGERAIDDSLLAQCSYAEAIQGPQFTGHRWPQWRQRLRLMSGLIKGTPFWVSDWSVKTFHRKTSTIVERWQPDIIQLEYHLMGQYLPALGGSRAPRILVEHEPALRAAPYVRTLPPFINDILNRLDRRAWRRFEQSVIAQVHAVVALTEQDRQALRPMAHDTPIVRIPIGSSLGQPLNPFGSQHPNLLFVGNFKHAPNVDAAERLINHILPLIHTHHPGVILNIVGTDPPLRLRQQAGHCVNVTGRVPAVRPYLDDATIVVIPLRLGGGMRVKTIEALAAGKAVAASPLALEGLDLRHGQQVMIAESDDDFSTAILELLRHPEKRERLASSAYRWAVSNLSWEHAAGTYETLYWRLLRDASKATGERYPERSTTSMVL